MEQQVFEQVDHYITRLMAEEDDILKRISLSLEANGFPNMSISPVQGKLLQVFAAACGAKNILELGTLAAYSTTWLARSLPEGGKLISIECDRSYAELAVTNIAMAGLTRKVDIRVGKALEILAQLEQETLPPFDLVFIDADKPPYVEYFQWALKLCRPGSIIIADNVIRDGKVLDNESQDEKVKGVQRFNKFLAECTHVQSIILQTVGIKEYDGMAIAVVK